MKKLLLLSLSLLLTNNLFSQANRSEYNLGLRQMNIEQQQNTFGEYKNLKGSPYDNEKFLPGKIYTEKEIIFNNLHLRYNAFSDEIEIKNSEINNKTNYGAIKRDSNVYIKILNKVYVFVPFDNSNTLGHYFEILSPQKSFDLYKKTTVKFYQPVEAVTSYDKSKPAEFKQTNIYYLVDKKGSFFELPSKKSKLFKVLSKENNKVKDYVKNNNLKLENEKDLIRLVSYYNSLL